MTTFHTFCTSAKNSLGLALYPTISPKQITASACGCISANTASRASRLACTSEMIAYFMPILAPLNFGELWSDLHRAVLRDLYLPGACSTKFAHVFGSCIEDFDRRGLLPLTIECRQGWGLNQRLVCYLMVWTDFQDDMRTSLPVRMQPDILWSCNL